MRSMQVDRWTVARVQLLFTCCSVINLSHYSLRSWLTSLVLQATRLRRDSMALTALAAGKKQQEVATNSYSHQQIPQKKYQKRSTKQNICSLLPIWLHTTKSIWHHGPMQGAPLSLPDHVDHEVSLNGHDLRKIKLNMVTIFGHGSTTQLSAMQLWPSEVDVYDKL